MLVAAVSTAAPAVSTSAVSTSAVSTSAVIRPGQAPDAGAVSRCAFDDDRLAEVSGLAWTPEGLRAVNDSGNESTVYRLGRDCSVAGARAVAVDGRDVEDLARSADGTLWLADTGDNARVRSSVAIVRLPPAGGEVVTRLTYPDGPHDVEALLLPPDGRPMLVTKEIGGRSGIYVPDAPLPAVPVEGSAEPTTDPVALRRVGEMAVPATSTPTTTPGAIGLLGGGLVTGGAMSVDGRVAVVRTYTDAWLYPVGSSSGPEPVTADAVVRALAGRPTQVALPGEPQGEAVALDPDGTLLSASESPPTRERGALRTVVGAVGRVTDAGGDAGGRVGAAAGDPGATGASDPGTGPAPAITESDRVGLGPAVPALLAVALAALAVGVGLVLVRRCRSR